MASDLTAGASKGKGRFRQPGLWTVFLAVGIAAIIGGGAILIGPFVGILERGQADSSALHNWQGGAHPPVVGTNPDATKTRTCGSSSPTDYALVSFGGPAQYHYAAVAGDGTWALLNSRSMVHYTGTSDPGQQGNVIIAFHREPDFQYINQLAVGDTITIQSRSCQTFVYRVAQRWNLPPSKVTQLNPTSGHELTLITCDPWWQDYNRLVWRAELISAPAAGGATGGSVGNPPF
jgi:LPXTG-site transpeptidase (sortase) family protein